MFVNSQPRPQAVLGVYCHNRVRLEICDIRPAVICNKNYLSLKTHLRWCRNPNIKAGHFSRCNLDFGKILHQKCFHLLVCIFSYFCFVAFVSFWKKKIPSNWLFQSPKSIQSIPNAAVVREGCSSWCILPLGRDHFSRSCCGPSDSSQPDLISLLL